MGTKVINETTGTKQSSWMLEWFESGTSYISADRSETLSPRFDIYLIESLNNKTKGLFEVKGVIKCDTYTSGVLRYVYGTKQGSGYISKNLTPRTWAELPLVSGSNPTIRASDLFNASNKTSRTVKLDFVTSLIAGASDDGGNFYGSFTDSTARTMDGLHEFILDAPPTTSYTQVQSDTGGKFFKNKTTAKVTLSNLSAKYGGDITEAKLTIGSQSATRTTNGDINIKLNATGTFTPVLSLKDSRGQTTTYNLNSIKVENMPIYAKVSGAWKLVAPKVKQSGTWKEPKAIYVKQSGSWKKIY